jgi:predicted dehydrogenase
MQVGSQGVSSIIYRRAKELLAAGAIGTLNMVTVWYDRNSAQGAWEYTVPYDASPTTCDWPRFLGTAPQIPFNAEHFFQWRKWKAYGSGVAGDLFVHLFSGVHFITSTHGPTRALGTGGLRFWKDGRDVPDVMMALYDYQQGFNLSVRTNFVDGGSESEGFVFTGSEGSMVIGGDGVTLSRVPREKEPGVRVQPFSEAIQKRMLEIYREKYPRTHPTGPALAGEEKYVAPDGYSDHYDHLKGWIEAIRTRRPVVEDPVFGFRAASAALLSNVSYDSGQPARWDPDEMKLL